jgi:TetR/AcrR family transcriptional repressor of nem operon
VARPKEFDREAALVKAMQVFWTQGYAATTTDDLRIAMGIGRQSLYDTFGDKRTLFLEAFIHYNEISGAAFAEACIRPTSAVAGIRAMLMQVADQTPQDRARGCLFVNTVAELADRDPEVGAIVKTVTESGVGRFAAAVQRAKDSKEVAASVDPKTAGRYLFSSLSGLRLAGKSGTSTAALRSMVDMILAGIGVH